MRATVAKRAGVSHDTVHKVRTIERRVREMLREMAAIGKRDPGWSAWRT